MQIQDMPVVVDEGIYVQIILTNLMCMRDFLSSSGDRVSLEEAQLFLRSPYDRTLYAPDMSTLRDQVENSVEEAQLRLQESELQVLWQATDLAAFLDDSSAVERAAQRLSALRVFTKEERVLVFLLKGKALSAGWYNPQWDAVSFTDLVAVVAEIKEVIDGVREVSEQCALHSAIMSRLQECLSKAEMEVDRRKNAWADVITMHRRCVKGSPCAYEDLEAALNTALQSQVSDADVVEKVQALLAKAKTVDETVRSEGYTALELLLDKLAVVLDCPSTLSDVIEKLAALPLGRMVRSSLKRNFEASGYIESARDVLSSSEESLRGIGYGEGITDDPPDVEPTVTASALDALEAELDLHCRAIAKSLSDAQAFNRMCVSPCDAVLTVPFEVLSAAEDIHRRCKAYVIAARSICSLRSHTILEEVESLATAWESIAAAMPDLLCANQVLSTVKAAFLSCLNRSRDLRDIMLDIHAKYRKALSNANVSYSALLNVDAAKLSEFKEEYVEMLLGELRGVVSAIRPLRKEVDAALSTLDMGLQKVPLVSSALQGVLFSLAERSCLVEIRSALELLEEMSSESAALNCVAGVSSDAVSSSSLSWEHLEVAYGTLLSMGKRGCCCYCELIFLVDTSSSVLLNHLTALIHSVVEMGKAWISRASRLFPSTGTRRQRKKAVKKVSVTDFQELVDETIAQVFRPPRFDDCVAVMTKAEYCMETLRDILFNYETPCAMEGDSDGESQQQQAVYTREDVIIHLKYVESLVAEVNEIPAVFPFEPVVKWMQHIFMWMTDAPEVVFQRMQTNDPTEQCGLLDYGHCLELVSNDHAQAVKDVPEDLADLMIQLDILVPG
ncbi:unnamed protein product, partial [Symbiodinium microadriaticum]